jgi:FHS family glucose/mannose:H+ symporter-like MFS transporter
VIHASGAVTEGPNRAATIVAYSIFAATGVGLVLPGALLSQLLARWSLDDQQAGLLFFVFFLGSSAGALLARGTLARAVAGGALCISTSSFALCFASRLTCFLSIALMGIGLGTTMTSISLLQSRRRPSTRTAEMARLNLIWSLGACAAPALLLKAAATWSLDTVLYLIGITFAVLALLAVVLLPRAKASTPNIVPTSRRAQFARLPLLLLLIVPLATGIESSTGGWLAAYSGRSGLLLGGTISTVSCFWLGLMLVRLLQSYRAVASTSQNYAFRLGTWIAAAALLLLILGPETTRDSIVIPMSAFLVGFGLGPIYPLALSLLLGHSEAGNLPFLIAGVGSSTLPLLTGVISDRSGSLAKGLAVPLAGAITMSVLTTIYAARKGQDGLQ